MRLPNIMEAADQGIVMILSIVQCVRIRII